MTDETKPTEEVKENEAQEDFNQEMLRVAGDRLSHILMRAMAHQMGHTPTTGIMIYPCDYKGERHAGVFAVQNQQDMGDNMAAATLIPLFVVPDPDYQITLIDDDKNIAEQRITKPGDAPIITGQVGHS